MLFRSLLIGVLLTGAALGWIIVAGPSFTGRAPETVASISTDIAAFDRMASILEDSLV